MRAFLLLLSLLGLVSCVTTSSSNTLDGTFVSFEQGDYTHLNVKDAQGKDRSFFVLTGDPSFSPFLAKPAAYKGKKVRVTWKEGVEDIPEAGGKMKVESATKIQLLP